MQASTPDEANRRLAQLLVVKGLINEQEYQATVDNSATATQQSSPSAFGQFVRAVYHPSPSPNAVVGEQTTVAPKAAEPAVIPAVAPLRVLPIDLPKQSGMIPDLKLGSGANMKIYGFFKSTAISDTASAGGATFGSQDWPLPLLVGGDTGPTVGSAIPRQGTELPDRQPIRMGSEELERHTDGQGRRPISKAITPMSITAT